MKMRTWHENGDSWTLPLCEFELTGDPRRKAAEYWEYFLSEFFTEVDRIRHPDIDYEAEDEFFYGYEVVHDGRVIASASKNVIRHIRGEITMT